LTIPQTGSTVFQVRFLQGLGEKHMVKISEFIGLLQCYSILTVRIG
jgi:hypothetical protein